MPVISMAGQAVLVQRPALMPGTAAQAEAPKAAISQESQQNQGKTSFMSILHLGGLQTSVAVSSSNEKTSGPGSDDSDEFTGIGCEQLLSSLSTQQSAPAACPEEAAAEGAPRTAQTYISAAKPDNSLSASITDVLQSEGAASKEAIPEARGENFASALNTAQYKESGADGKTEGGVGSKAVSVSQTGVTEKIVETLRSMSESETSGSASGESASQEKETAAPEVPEGFFPAAGPKYAEAAEKTEDSVLKSQAVENALDHFVSDLSVTVGEKSEIRIELEPENLGALTISVSRGENGISAKIRSADRETCAIITDQVQKLIQSMESKGIKVDDVDVVFGQTESDLSFTQNSHSNGGGNMPRHYLSQAQGKTETSDHTGIVDIWQGFADVADEVSGAVEYRV